MRTATKEKITKAPMRETNADSNGRNKMKAHLEYSVGLFVIIAIIGLIWGISWLKALDPLHPPQKVTVKFHDIAGLNNNAPVNVNGVRVGTVDKISLKGKGLVHVTLRIKTEEVTLPKGSRFTIQTLGLVGAKYIEITLPEIDPNQPPPDIKPDEIVDGEDPVRVELVINKIATKLNSVVGDTLDDKAGSGLKEALEHSGEAVRHINEAAQKLNKNMDKWSATTESLTETSRKIGDAADQAKAMASNARAFFGNGSSTLQDIKGAAKDSRVAFQKVSKVLDNPALSGDLKETATQARQTAEAIQSTMQEINQTLKDTELRKELNDMLNKLSASTQNIRESVTAINKLANDGELKTDIRDTVREAKETVEGARKLINEVDVAKDIPGAIKNFKNASANIDIAAKQLNQVLGKRFMLFHLMFGRPGYIPDAKSVNASKRETPTSNATPAPTNGSGSGE